MPRTPPTAFSRDNLKRKLMSLSHGQELCQLAALASLPCAANQEPACLLTKLLTMTTTYKFPSQENLLVSGRMVILFASYLCKVTASVCMLLSYSAVSLGTVTFWACTIMEHIYSFPGNVLYGLTTTAFGQGWKFMSCGHCQELGQQASGHLIGCTRVNNQSQAR